MEFTSNLFLLFVIVFFSGYIALSRFNATLSVKNFYISWVSFFFYAFWYPPALAIILINAISGKVGGIWLKNSERKKPALALLIFISLGILFLFKYYNFFIEITDLKSWKADIILPLGISFYTFTIIGYYIDVFRGDVEPVNSLTDSVLFITFWPHLASGPILRAQNIFHNISLREKLTGSNIYLSIILIMTGLVKKLLIADNIGAYVNWNLGYGISGMNLIESWSVVIGFAAQIYADFSGYSDMAIGFALLLGFRLPANFNYPYLSTSVTEFWRRWHISLSFWLKDYLYIPLGGSKNGAMRMYLSIMVVFSLSGLWHGAAWNFLLWGTIHGVILVLEKIFSKIYFKINGHVRWFITIIIIMVTWAFFRLNHTDAFALVAKLFDFSNGFYLNFVPPYNVVPVFLLVILIIIDHTIKFYKVDDDGFPASNNSIFSIIILSILFIAALFLKGEELPFIYFQF